MTGSVHQSAFERAPTEIIVLILGCLHSTNDLRSVLLTHSVFTSVFRENSQRIIADIVFNRIPPRALPFALALHDSEVIGRTGDQAVAGLFEALRLRASSPSEARNALSSLSIGEAVRMGRNFEAVSYFSDELARQAIPHYRRQFGLQHADTISERERRRLHESFYRYQLFCNLFCTGPGVLRDESEHRGMFFDCFPIWTNEQLSCVYAFLERKIIPAFDDMAMHDLEWGEIPIQYMGEPSWCDAFQHLLAKGLPVLQRIYKAKDYSEREPLLNLKHERVWGTGGRLSDHLQFMVWGGHDHDFVDYDDLIADDERLQIRFDDLEELLQQARPGEPLVSGDEDGLDSCPFVVWFGAHADRRLSETGFDCYEDRHGALYNAGYTFWDFEEPTSEMHSAGDGDASAALLSVSRRVTEHLKQQTLVPLIRTERVLWSEEEALWSERQRCDVGGSGWLPLYRPGSSEEPDFSRVREWGTSATKDQLRQLWDNRKHWGWGGHGYS